MVTIELRLKTVDTILAAPRIVIAIGARPSSVSIKNADTEIFMEASVQKVGDALQVNAKANLRSPDRTRSTSTNVKVQPGVWQRFGTWADGEGETTVEVRVIPEAPRVGEDPNPGL
jgi:hypothetical protein